jgi:hypothetical protein
MLGVFATGKFKITKAQRLCEFEESNYVLGENFGGSWLSFFFSSGIKEKKVIRKYMIRKRHVNLFLFKNPFLFISII